MRKSLRLTALASIAVLMVAACSGGREPDRRSLDAAPSVAPSAAASEAPSAAPTVTADSLLGKILAAGKIRISTDPNYAPFSFYDTATGKYTGFDNATAEEVVKRLNKQLGKNIALEWVTPELGPHHRRQLGRPLGHLDRLDEHHEGP